MRYGQVAFAAALVAAALIGAGCPSRPAVKQSSQEQVVVEAFLEAMVADDEEAQAALISPAWLDEQNIDLEYEGEYYRINGYTPTGFKITGVKAGLVTAEIEFGGGGAHRLVFQVRDENGRGYIVPGSIEDDDFDELVWINPWFEVESNIR